MGNASQIEFKPFIHITSNISIGEASFNGQKFNAFRIDIDNPETALQQINNSKSSYIVNKYFCSEADTVLIRPQKGDVQIVNDSSSKCIVFLRRIPEGKSLDEKLKENLPFTDFLKLFLKVILVVQKAHKINLHHGWLNPHNIFVAAEGGVCITGWEECTFTKQALKVSSGSDLIEMDSFYEKFASPESKSINTSIDEQSDVYSLGRIFEESLKAYPEESQNSEYRQFIENCVDITSENRWHLTEVNEKVRGFIEQLSQVSQTSEDEDGAQPVNNCKPADNSVWISVLSGLLLLAIAGCIGLTIYASTLRAKNAELQNQIDNQIIKPDSKPVTNTPPEPTSKSEPVTEPAVEPATEPTDQPKPQPEQSEDVIAKINLAVENATGSLYEDVSECILDPNYKNLFADKLNKWDPSNPSNIEKKAALLDKLVNSKSSVVLKEETQKEILNKLIDRLQAATKADEKEFISESQSAIQETIREEFFDNELVVDVVIERIKRAFTDPKIRNNVESQKESLAFLDSLSNCLPLQLFTSQPKLCAFCENYKKWYSEQNKISFELTSIKAKLTIPEGEKYKSYINNITSKIEGGKTEKKDKMPKIIFDNSYFDKDTETSILKSPYQFEITPTEVFSLTSTCCLNGIWQYPAASIDIVPFSSQSKPSCQVKFEKENSTVTLEFHIKTLDGQQTAEDIYNDAFNSKPTSQEASPNNEQKSDNDKAVTEDAANKESEQSATAEPDA